jgi:uncharacterized membrane protein
MGSGQLTKRNLTLDEVVAILGLCVGIVFFTWSIILERYGAALPGVLMASSLLYLLFRKWLMTSAAPFQFRLGNRIRLLSHIIFTMSLSLGVWLLWSNLYYRPPTYFILCLVAVASVVLNVFALDETKISHISVVLFKIIALSITIYACIYYQFPGIYGVDPWWHNHWIQETVNLGHITEGQFIPNTYFLFPVFHLAGATMQIVTGLSTYSSVFIAVSLLVVVSSTIVFLIGRKLFNTRVGLLAALIVPLAVDTIERATALIPMSLGFCFFLAILYFVFYSDRKRVSDRLLVILLSVALILTHTVAALATLLSLIAIFIGIKLSRRTNKPFIPHELVSLDVIMFFGVAMLASWLQAPPGGETFFEFTFENLVSALRSGTEFVLAAPPTATNAPYTVFILDEGGYLLLLTFAIIGALVYLHPRNRTTLRIALASIAVIVFAVLYGSLLLSLENILPGRWYLFLYVPLSIFAVSGFLSVFNLIKSNGAKLGMIMLIVLAIVFMTTTNSAANDDSPQVFNGARRLGYTQSELTAINTLSDMEAGQPMTDIYYGLIYPYVIGNDQYLDMVQGESRVFIHRNYYMHHPEWNQRYISRIYLRTGYQIWESEQVLISDYIKEQGIDRWPLIYSNKDVTVYSNAVVLPWNR